MNFIYWGRYGSVLLTFAVPLSLILSEGKGWDCSINTKFNLISEQKRKNMHIFLQFATENLNDCTVSGKIFLCALVLDRNLIPKWCFTSCISHTAFFVCHWIILFERHLCGAKVMNRSFIAGMFFLHYYSFLCQCFILWTVQCLTS